jgi:chromosome partitioning protein
MPTQWITVTSEKGGVAATTTVVNLAHALAQDSHKTLVVDADPQASAAIALGLDPGKGLWDFLVEGSPIHLCVEHSGRDHLYMLPGNTRSKAIYDRLNTKIAMGEILDAATPLDYIRDCFADFDVEGYRYAVLDTPKYGPLQEIALQLAHAIIIPTAMDNLSLNGVANMMAAIDTLNPTAQRLILPTFFHKNWSLDQHNLENLTQAFPGIVYEPLPARAAIREATAHGKTILEYAGKSDLAQLYLQLAAAIIQTISSPTQDE